MLGVTGPLAGVPSAEGVSLPGADGAPLAGAAGLLDAAGGLLGAAAGADGGLLGVLAPGCAAFKRVRASRMTSRLLAAA